MHKFYKYQGAGNDFIVFDNRNHSFGEHNTELIQKLCDRRFGIGADGLMLLQEVAGYDFEMIYFNADGREGSMCGNGGRCIVAFANHLGIFGRETAFLAADGAHAASLTEVKDTVKLQMIDVDEVEQNPDFIVLNTGSPHYVQRVQGLHQMDVVAQGRLVRYNDRFSTEGINVNFVEKTNKGYSLRTYERGVEDETLACGTGATAVAMAMALHEGLEGDLCLPVQVMGGDLTISFHKEGRHFTNVYLEGPAKFVFSGEIDFNNLL